MAILENKKNMKNVIVQYNLALIIKYYQQQNEILMNRVKELEYEVEDTIDNIDAKKKVLKRKTKEV